MITTAWFFGEEHLQDVHMIRREVFMTEQGVSEADEMDGTDGACIHLAAYEEDEPAAAGRIMITKDEFLIGRVAVLKPYRGRHFGRLIMQMLIHACYEMGGDVQTVHAQISARPFYERLGFAVCGEVYEEAGIPHVPMRHSGDCEILCQGCGARAKS